MQDNNQIWNINLLIKWDISKQHAATVVSWAKMIKTGKPMKLLPLTAALLISAAPVHAFEADDGFFKTFEELDKACRATEENNKLCMGSTTWTLSGLLVVTLCRLNEKGMLTTEEVIEHWEETKDMKLIALWRESIEDVIDSYPNCPIKLVP